MLRNWSICDTICSFTISAGRYYLTGKLRSWALYTCVCSLVFFFLNERRQDCAPFLLVKEFTSKRSQRSENRSKKKYTIQKYNKRSQAPLKNEARRFAPAIPQARASSLILSSKFVADCSFRWKVRALRSFQISQTTKSIRERNPLRGTPVLVPSISHH